MKLPDLNLKSYKTNIGLKSIWTLCICILAACAVRKPSSDQAPKKTTSPNSPAADSPTPSDATPHGSQLLDDAAAEALAAKDYAQLSPQQQSTTKYITVTHLKSLDATQLDTVRFGFEKMVNSISTTSDVVKLTPLDPTKSIYRLNFSDYGWTSATWKLILSDKYSSTNIKQTTSGAVIAKGDWLVFAASRPEVYDKIIGIPQLESMLESSIGADISKSIFLGVSKSIVANNGRILQRTSIKRGSRNGYYWRTYDWQFKSGSDAALAKPDPWYSRDRSIPDLIAGELIWTLPNGLQAYMLTGFGKQHRYDAVLEVAQDKRRADKLVINGESCFSCHSDGLNVRDDEVRPKFMNNGDFDQDTKNKLMQLYPEQQTINSLFASDQAIYKEAIAKLGYPQIQGDSVSATCAIFIKNRGLTDKRQQRGDTDAVFGF